MSAQTHVETRGRGSSFRPLAALLFVALAVAGCGRSSPVPVAPFDLSVYFTADIKGRLVPCGCFTGQYGGMTRLKTALDSEAPPDSLRVDVGDAIAGAADYDVIQYRYQIKAFAEMRFDALNLGHREAELSAARWRDLRKSQDVPWVSANLVDATTRERIAEPYRIVERGPYKIAIVGVADPQGMDDRLGDGLALEPMETALSAVLPQVRPLADVVVLLAFTDERGMTRLAQQFYEIDLILGGDVRQPAQELKKENRSLIFFTTNESRALGILRLAVAGRSQVTPIYHEIRLLHDRVPQAPDVAALAAAYRDEIRRTPLAVDDPSHLQADQVPGVRAKAEFTGSEACLSCHPSAAEKWQQSGHAHAFETLVRAGADADPRCIGCHTVGFGTPSGYRREFAAAKLINVGCESCHGPGSLHVRQQQGDASVNFKFRPLGAGDCQKCHYGEFSRPFDWTTFWPRVAHGPEPRSAGHAGAPP